MLQGDRPANPVGRNIERKSRGLLACRRARPHTETERIGATHGAAPMNVCAAAQCASGSGRTWMCTARGLEPLPPSFSHGVRSPFVLHSPRPFRPAFGNRQSRGGGFEVGKQPPVLVLIRRRIGRTRPSKNIVERPWHAPPSVSARHAAVSQSLPPSAAAAQTTPPGASPAAATTQSQPAAPPQSQDPSAPPSRKKLTRAEIP